MTTLTLPQQDIYYDQLLYPQKAIYNIGARIVVQGTLNLAALRAAYDQLLQQHDALRMTIVNNNNEPRMKILEAYEPTFGFRDFSSCADADAEAQEYMRNEFVVPFDLQKEGLLHRSCLLKISESFYYIFAVCHHIITDGYGTSLIFQRWIRNYNEILETGSVQSSYPFNYITFAEDEAEYERSQSFVQDRNYWVNKFSSLPDDLIPKRYSLQAALESSREQLLVKRAFYSELEQFAKDRGVTTFHVILGVLYSYLGRCYGNNDFAIGLPVLNRGKSGYKNTVGLFMGVSPLRMQLDFEASFEALIAQIRNQLRQDYRHQRFPISKLIQELNVFRERDKLFNVTLSYEKHNYADAFAVTSTKVIPLTHRAERVALALYIREYDARDDVRIDFDYNLDYFSDEQMQRLTQHFDLLLKNVVHRPADKLKDLEFLSPDEKDELLKGFTYIDYPADKSIYELFNAQVQLNPNKVAVKDDHTSYTYLELDKLSARVMLYLTDAPQHCPVAVKLDRSASVAGVLLGILRSGRSFIPLDPAFPASRIEYILEHSGCKVLIDQLDEVLLQTQETDEHTYGDSAYIIYTSGSTGNPKGVEVGQRSVVNFLTSMMREPGIRQNDVLFAVTTYSFDISILEVFLPLVAGATVYMTSNEILSDPAKILKQVQAVRPTILQATPSFYQLLFNAGWKGDKNLKCLCGGDSLGELLAAKLVESTAELWNMYGPTETTIWSTTKRILQPADASNIGKPVNNTTVLILDQWLKPVPAGAPGNIYIGGHGVAKGYYRNEALTRASFIEHGGRIFKTGDSGRWDFNGEIHFMGRTDNQVKVRGYRIELGEIEKKLTELPGIKEAVVIAKKSEGHEAFLVGYIIPVEPNINTDDITGLLGKSLPAYMIPRVIVELDAFPLTPNKKIDRKALAKRELTLPEPGPIAIPQTDLEEKLLHAWRAALNAENISITDNFFALGGHSLNAVKLAGYISNEFGFELPFKTVFDHPTIKQLAAHLQAHGCQATEIIPHVSEQPSYELTPSQRKLWLLSQKKEASLAYNMSIAYLLQGELDVNRLSRAVKASIDRHEILRTNFKEINGEPRQVIRPANEVDFSITHSHAEKAFDLENDLLLRVQLVQQQLLIFTTHHLVMDGWSVEVLINEIAHHYNNGAPVKPLQLQFKDYSAWINKKISNNQPAEAFWRNELADYNPVPGIPRDYQTKQPSFNGSMLRFEFSTEETAALKQLAKEQNSTVFAVLSTLLNILIFKYSHHADVCVATVSAGRDHPALADQIGMYANTVILRLRLQPAISFAGQLQSTQQTIRNAFAHQYYAEEKVIDPRKEPLFDCMLVYQNPEFSFHEISTLNGVSLQPYELPHTVTRLPLTFNFHEKEGALACNIEFNTGMFETGTIRLLAERFKKIAGQAMHHPNKKIEDYSISLHAEKKLKEKISIDLDF
jgi:amino acid adenylation domain-containing protein